MSPSDLAQRLVFLDHPSWAQQIEKWLDESTIDLALLMETLSHWRKNGDRISSLQLLESIPRHRYNRRIRLELIAEYIYQEHFAKAKLLSDEMLASDPKDIQVLMRKSNLLKKQGKYTSAKEVLIELLGHKPSFGLAHLELARIYRLEKQWSKALDQLSQIDLEGPLQFHAFLETGIAYRSLGDYPSSIEYLKKAISCASGPPALDNARLHLAEAYRDTGRGEEALYILNEVTSEIGRDRKYKVLATTLEMLSRWQEAWSVLSHLSGHDRHRTFVQKMRSRLLAKQGRFTEQIDFLTDLSAQFQESWTYLQTCQAYRKIGDFGRALSCIEKALDLDINRVHVLQKTEILMILNRNQECFDFLQVMIPEVDESLALHHRRYQVAMRLGRYEEARDSAEKAVQLDPQNLKSKIWLLHVSVRLGYDHDSLEELEQLVMESTDLDLYRKLADHYRYLADHKSSLRVHQKGLERSGAESDREVFLVRIGQDLIRQNDMNGLKSWVKDVRECPTSLKLELLFEEALGLLHPEDNRAWRMDELLNKYPDQSEVLLYCIRYCCSHGDFDRAMDLIGDLYREDSVYFDWRQKALKGLGRHDEAIRSFKAKLESAPSDTSLKVSFCHYLLDINKFQVGWRYSRIHSSDFEKSSLGLYALARAAFFAGRLGRCRETVKTGLRRYGFKKYWHNLHMTVLRTQGRYDEVIRYINESVDPIFGFSAPLYRIRGESFYNLYRYEEALADFRQNVKETDNRPAARVQIASMLYVQGRVGEALQELKLGTHDLSKRKQGQKVIPTQSMIYRLVQEARSNVLALSEIEKVVSSQESNIEEWSRLLLKYPGYVFGSIQFLKMLRSRGFLDIPERNGIRDIPKRIVQYWDSAKWTWGVMFTMNQWRKFHPDFEYEILNAREAYVFLKENFDNRSAEAFLNCRHAAEQSDYIRLAYLYTLGGVYADVDDLSMRDISSLLSGAQLVVSQEYLGTIANNFIACVPGHPVIREAFHKATERLLSYTNEAPWFKTGPGLLSEVIAKYLSDEFVRSGSLEDLGVVVLSAEQIREYVWLHRPMEYKGTNRSWFRQNYVKALKNSVKAK